MVPASYYSVEDRSKYKLDITAIDGDTEFKPVTRPEFEEFYNAVLAHLTIEASKVKGPYIKKGGRRMPKGFGGKAEGGIIFPTKNYLL